MIATILILLTVLVAFYAIWGRSLLDKTSWGHDFILWIEPFEIVAYRKSQTLLFGRFMVILGSVLTIVANADASTIQAIAALLPDNLSWVARAAPLVISLAGAAVEALRRDTTKPLEQVALPSDAPADLLAAAATADSVSKTAVADIKAATAVGRV